MKLRILLGMLTLAAVANAAIIDIGARNASELNPIPAGTTYTAGLTAGGGIDAPVDFVTPAVGMLTITITDCCLVGDVYEVLLDGVSLGLTTAVPIDGPDGTSGVFVVHNVAAGNHSMDVWDIVLSYMGQDSPFGGGTVRGEFSPAALEYKIEFFEDAPEPSTLTMAALGLATVVAAMRRRSSNS